MESGRAPKCSGGSAMIVGLDMHDPTIANMLVQSIPQSIPPLH